MPIDSLEVQVEYMIGDIVSVVSGLLKGDGGRVTCVHRRHGKATLQISRANDTTFLISADLVKMVEEEK